MIHVWLLLLMAGGMGGAALGGFLWAVKRGLFENAEDTKFVVFRDEDEEK